jgi:phosphoribosylanthranilate isomerase
MTRVKICGITTPEDARMVVDAGADALGLVFYPPSPRYVTLEQALRIAEAIPPLVSIVGLFVNASREAIGHVTSQCPLDLIQLHGDESPNDCRNLPTRVIKALRVAVSEDLTGLERYPVQGLLLDAKVGTHYGGTGQTFDWSVLSGFHPPAPLILAGGLHPDNVADAIRQVRPFAVDCSSGVESRPGRKDPDNVRRFIHNAKHAWA